MYKSNLYHHSENVHISFNLSHDAQANNMIKKHNAQKTSQSDFRRQID